MFFSFRFAHYTFAARKRGAAQMYMVEENDQNSYEKRFQNHLKTL